MTPIEPMRAKRAAIRKPDEYHYYGEPSRDSLRRILDYERALKEFWQAAYEFEHASNFHPYHDQETYLEAARIIAEVEAL